MRKSGNQDVASQQLMTPVGSWFLDKFFSSPQLAHHPPCRCYDDHVLRCGRFILCLGCTCMLAGTTLGIAALACSLVQQIIGFGWHGVMPAIGTGVGLYLPTLLQPCCQWKPYKIVARLLLGVAVVALFTGGLLLPPLSALGTTARIVFVVTFWLVFKATLRHRARHTPDPCSRCSPAVYPFCQDNRPRVASLLAELRRRAGPGDEAFVSFAAALAGEETAGVQVEVTPLQSLAAIGAGSKVADCRSCHGRTSRQASGSSRPS